MARPDGPAGRRLRGGGQVRRRPLADPARRDPSRASSIRWSPRPSRSADLRSRADVARAYGELIRRVDEEARKSAPTISAAPRTRRAGRSATILADHESPAYFPESQTYYYMSRGEKDAFGGKLTELDRMTVKAADAWPRAMVLFDARRALRAADLRAGQSVPAGRARAPAVPAESWPAPDRRPFAHGSGRLDLARAITAPDNPLTSRVIVNRVWMHHFGEPLVSTPSDFGTRSTPPSHPELLDYLAGPAPGRGLVAQGAAPPDHALEHLPAVEPRPARVPPGRPREPAALALPAATARPRGDARHAPVRRRAGSIGRMGGRPVDVAGDPKNRRRTVYGLVDRQSLPAMFRAFDFASPDQSAERRPRTTVPQQALFSMNAPFVIEQAKALAARPDVAGAPTTEARIAALYRAVLARPACPGRDPGRRALRRRAAEPPGESGHSQLSRWEQLAQVLLMTNEFLFVD